MALIQQLRSFTDLPRNTTSLTIPETAFLVCPQDVRLVKAVFLVDGFDYQTAIARLGLRGRRSVLQWIEQFVHYYNYQRPHQSLDNRTPTEEVVN